MEQLANVLPDDGTEMPFEDFVAAARSAGLNPQMWLKAKHAGFVQTRINDAGQHVISRVQAEG